MQIFRPLEYDVLISSKASVTTDYWPHTDQFKFFNTIK